MQCSCCFKTYSRFSTHRPRAPHPYFCSIHDAVQLLRKGMPKTRVVILGLLPRGTLSGRGGPADSNDMTWPSHYTQATADLNARLK